MNTQTNIQSIGQNGKWNKRAKILFYIILIIELCLVFKLNLTQQYIQESDEAKVFYHTICFAKEGKFVFPDWHYETTGEWDCASMFALPVYLLTHDIFLSIGIANCLNALLVCAVFLTLFRRIGDHSIAGPLSACLVLLPYSVGWLEYMNMMFYGGAMYIYKSLIGVWLIALLERPAGRIRASGVLETAAFLFILFALGSSSGLYPIACGIAPVLACRLVLRLSGANSQPLRRSAVRFFLVLFAAGAGYLVHRGFGMTTLADEMTLLTASDAFEKIKVMLVDMFRLIHTFPEENISPFSPSALFCVGRIVLWIVAIAAAAGASRGFLGLDRICKKGEPEQEQLHRVRSELVSVLLWNAGVLYLVDSQPRYHLIGFLPLMILAAMYIGYLIENAADWKIGAAINAAAFGWLILMNAGLWVNAFRSYRSFEQTYSDSFNRVADEAGVDSILFLNTSQHAEIARVMDLDHKIGTYWDEGKLMCVDDFTKKEDRAWYSDRHILVVEKQQASLDSLPGYLKQFYTLIYNPDDNTEVYLAETNRLDGRTGPASERSIDYPYSPGYQWDKWNSIVDERGFLHLSGQSVTSPAFRTGELGSEMRIFCEPGSGTASVRITENGETSVFPLDGTEFAHTIAPGTDFSFVITDEQDSGIAVDRIEFTPEGN